MRDYKFKVWDIDHDCMHENIGIDKIHLYDFKGDNITEQEGLIIMQYTGLKDKNGVEIYEGDIFKENKSTGEIKYADASFFIDWKIIKDFWSDSLKHHAIHGEVTGNIYENAELLVVIPS